MYLRFEGRLPVPGTPNNLGIFQLAYRLRDSAGTLDYARDALSTHLDWQCRNLAVPDIYGSRREDRAVCWFKPEAREALAHIWPIKTVLEDFGYVIDVVRARRPGWIVYQDRWQIAAKPDRWARVIGKR